MFVKARRFHSRRKQRQGPVNQGLAVNVGVIIAGGHMGGGYVKIRAKIVRVKTQHVKEGTSLDKARPAGMHGLE